MHKRLDRPALAAFFLVLLPACLGNSAKSSAQVALPPPFTAEQIQAANPPGTVLVYRVEQPDAAPILRTMHFLADDGERATVESSMVDAASGEALADATTREHPWTELRDHAVFPADRTDRRVGRAEVPAGSYEAWIYLVFVEDQESGAMQKQRFYFALDQPGPPVLFEVEDHTGTTYRMALVERRGP